MKLFKLHELETTKNYLELYPGRLRNGYMNEESVYVTDDDFSLIVAAVKRGFEWYAPFESFIIGKSMWKSILNELLKLTVILNEIPDNSKLDNYISIFYKDEKLRKSKIEEYLKKRIALLSLIEDLSGWIDAKLVDEEYITLIGI